MNSSDNSTSSAFDTNSLVLLPSVWMRIIATCISIPVILVGGIGNVTILLAFVINRKSLWKKQNIYLFCLSLTDLSTATLAAAGLLDEYLYGRWRYSKELCRVFQAEISIAYIASLNFVALISRDRMLMVTKGASYDTYETAGRKWLYAALNMVYLGFSLLPFHSYDIFSGVSIFDPNSRCNPEELQSFVVTAVVQITQALPPFVFMVYYYARVRQYLRARDEINAVKSANAAAHTEATSIAHLGKPSTLVVSAINIQGSSNNRDSVLLEKNRRAFKLMIVFLISTLQCALPNTLAAIVMNVFMANPTLVSPETYAWWSDLYSLAFMWCATASAVNPFLYAYAMPSFRKVAQNVGRTFWRLVPCKKE